MTTAATMPRAHGTAGTLMICRQASALDGFRYTVRDAVTDHDQGEIVWPAFSQAKNARLRLNSDPRKGEISIHHAKQRYGVAYEFLDRGWVNDARYMLMDGETQLAVADLRTEPRLFARAKMRLLEPVAASFVRRSRFPRMRFELLAEDGRVLGTIAERAAFMTVRELVADLPDSLPVPTKMFAIFLALHLLQTQA